MSVQDDKTTDHDEKATDQDDKPTDQDDKGTGQDGEQQATEKPEPNDEHKEKAAEMMTAYEDRPTLVLPGSGRMVTGTAVNDWLDDDGNPKFEVPENAAEDHEAKAKETRENKKDQIEEDKALNEELRKAAAEENKGEESKSSR